MFNRQDQAAGDITNCSIGMDQALIWMEELNLWFVPSKMILWEIKFHLLLYPQKMMNLTAIEQTAVVAQQ